MILKLTNANTYLNGQTLIGKVEEVNLPDIKPKEVSYKPLGMQSEISLPSGFEKMEAKIKFNALYTKEYLQLCNVHNVNVFTIRGNQESYNNTGRTSDNSYICTIGGMVKVIPLGKFTQNEMTGIEISLNIHNLSVKLGEDSIITIDVMSNLYKVGDLDLLEGFKKYT